jgi:hypothetical protein
MPPHEPRKQPSRRTPTRGAPPRRQARPRWDKIARELWLGDTLVKKFLRPAPLQELILAVFEEEGWPERIDDPLPGPFDGDRRDRLHKALQKLNRNQQVPLLEFHRDGTGEKIVWRLR